MVIFNRVQKIAGFYFDWKHNTLIGYVIIINKGIYCYNFKLTQTLKSV